jgi:putative oxidoreductase
MTTNDSHDKGIFGKLAASPASAQDLGIALVRIGFGLSLAFAHGLGKISHPDQFIGGLTQGGFPLPSLFGWAAILSEFAGGLLLALGLLARPAAAFVVATLGVAAFHVHSADPYQKKELALAYVLVAIAVLVAGPGRFSLDGLLASRISRRTTDATRAPVAS